MEQYKELIAELTDHTETAIEWAELEFGIKLNIIKVDGLKIEAQGHMRRFAIVIDKGYTVQKAGCYIARRYFSHFANAAAKIEQQWNTQ